MSACRCRQAKVLSALGMDVSFGNPLELARAQYLEGAPADLAPAFIDATEELLSKSANTTIWLEVSQLIYSY